VAPEAITAVLLDSLVFRAYDDALPALAGARARGWRIVVASNWDCSLPETLAHVGLLDAVDGVVSSAAFGAAKPDPALFAQALRIAGAGPADAIHVGDSVEEDVAGARAAGVEPVLLVRGEDPAPAAIRSLRSLLDLPAMLDALAGQTVLG
jgi:putative hydrolase of the HAD superfamily